MNLDQTLITMLRERAESVAATPVVPERTVRRVRVRKAVMAGSLAATVAAVAVAGALVRSAIWTDAAPVPPAQGGDREIEPERYGRILSADGGFWQGSTAPPPPGGQRSYAWDAFDQDTGSFLYPAPSIDGRVWVVGEDGPVAEFDCPPPSECGARANEMQTFGPGPDEVTVPSTDALPWSRPRDEKESEGRSAYVIGFDGTLHETLDISAVFSRGQDLTDLAWSPDGERLAVSTENYIEGCDLSGLCGRVWIFDRDGGEPQLVYTERDTGYDVLRDLAWSPDGNDLGLLLVASPSPDDSCAQPSPRLVALHVAVNERVRAQTVSAYDHPDLRDALCHNLVEDDFHIAFPFAWSPDGTRIAVATGGGITEISAENGEVLARHPGKGVQGPLAWLPER